MSHQKIGAVYQIHINTYLDNKTTTRVTDKPHNTAKKKMQIVSKHIQFIIIAAP